MLQSGEANQTWAELFSFLKKQTNKQKLFQWCKQLPVFSFSSTHINFDKYKSAADPCKSFSGTQWFTISCHANSVSESELDRVYSW